MKHQKTRERAQALASDGLTYRQIAKQLGIQPLAVFDLLGDTGEESAFADMARMRASGMTNKQIADARGVCRQYVNKVLGKLPNRGRKVERRQIRMADGTWPRVSRAAKSLGLRYESGQRASEGDVGQMLDAIARNEIDVKWKPGCGPDTVLTGAKRA